MENKLKHLEFIQNVITRLNTNSFLIKGWSVTLIAAMFALAAKESNQDLAILVYIVIPFFWVLDGFFLSREKCFRELYKEVALRSTPTDFSMNCEQYCKDDKTWPSTIFNKTLIIFHGVLLLVTIILMCVIK